MTENPFVVSFCTTCKGRLQYLKQTLQKNMEGHLAYEGVEFVLLDYSCPEGTEQWIRHTMAAHIESGRLTYYRIDGCVHFKMAHAKNVAHRVAKGAIVCNVDADNFTGNGFAAYLTNIFQGKEQLLVRPVRGAGVTGRIALLKRDFEALGGYDESFEHGWGFEDLDLVMRARAMGFIEHRIPESTGYCGFIPSKHEIRNQYSHLKDFKESDRIHRALSSDHIASGKLIANCGSKWGAAVLVKNFCNIVTI